MSLFDSILTNENVQFSISLILTIVAVTLAYLFLKLLVKKFVGRKKTYGDFIFKKISKPVFILIFISGLYIAMEINTALDVYKNLIDNTFFIVFSFAIAFLISRILSVLMLGWLRVRKGFERTPGLLNKTLTIIIFIIAVVVILGYFKVDITPMIAGVGLGAVVIGLALQSTLANFFAGIHLLSDKPIDVGDYIEVDDNTKGVVEDIGWRSTRIKTLTDNLLIIPNGKLAESNITNFSKPKQDLSIWVSCGVAYESDLKKVEKISLEVAKQIQQTIDGAVKEFDPVFRYRDFGDSNINFITVLRVNEPLKRFAVKNEFIKALKDRFDKENIEISWPIRKIYQIK